MYVALAKHKKICFTDAQIHANYPNGPKINPFDVVHHCGALWTHERWVNEGADRGGPFELPSHVKRAVSSAGLTGRHHVYPAVGHPPPPPDIYRGKPPQERDTLLQSAREREGGGMATK